MGIIEKSEYYKWVNHTIDDLKKYKPKEKEKESLRKSIDHYTWVSKRIALELKKAMWYIKTEKWQYWCKTSINWETIDHSNCKQCNHNDDYSICISIKQKELMDELLAKYYEDEE